MSIVDLAKQTKALADKATPGPWDVKLNTVDGETYLYVWRDAHRYNIARTPDIMFMDHVRTAAPQLADAAIRLTAENEKLKSERVEVVEVLKFYAGWHQRSLEYQEFLNTPETPLTVVPANTARELLAKLGITEGEE